MSAPLEPIFASLRSRDLGSWFFRVNKIRFEIFNVFGRLTCFCYVFVGGPAGPDPRRAPGGPRAPAGPHQGSGEGPGESLGEGPGPRGGPRGESH